LPIIALFGDTQFEVSPHTIIPHLYLPLTMIHHSNVYNPRHFLPEKRIENPENTSAFFLIAHKE
jgi:hypothetical protein